MTKSIISQAQQFANDRKVTVILCGDWNCPVDKIILPMGACLAIPMSPSGDNEEAAIDAMIVLNPVTNSSNIMLADVQFIGWTGNVTADEMNRLLPAKVDAIYHGGKGGKHRPIHANIISYQLLVIQCDNLM